MGARCSSCCGGEDEDRSGQDDEYRPRQEQEEGRARQGQRRPQQRLFLQVRNVLIFQCYPWINSEKLMGLRICFDHGHNTVQTVYKITGYKINLDIRLIFSGTNAYLISGLHCTINNPWI